MKNVKMVLVIAITTIFAGCNTTNVSNSENGYSQSPKWKDGIYKLSEIDTQPKPVYQVPPIYPFEYKRAKVSGEAVIGFMIDKKGIVQDAFVVKATNESFGLSALAAVKRWKFMPGIKNGKEVDCLMQVPLYFSIN